MYEKNEVEEIGIDYWNSSTKMLPLVLSTDFPINRRECNVTWQWSLEFPNWNCKSSVYWRIIWKEPNVTLFYRNSSNQSQFFKLHFSRVGNFEIIFFFSSQFKFHTFLAATLE